MSSGILIVRATNPAEAAAAWDQSVVCADSSGVVCDEDGVCFGNVCINE